MSKKKKSCHIPGLHFWCVSYKLDKKDIGKILEIFQSVIEDIRKKL